MVIQFYFVHPLCFLFYLYVSEFCVCLSYFNLLTSSFFLTLSNLNIQVVLSARFDKHRAFENRLSNKLFKFNDFQYLIIHWNAHPMLQITRILDRFHLNLKFDSHASSLSTCIFTSFEISPSLCVLIHSQPLFLLTRNQPKMRCCFVAALKQYFRNVLVSLLFLPSHSFILSSSLRRATMVVLF